MKKSFLQLKEKLSNKSIAIVGNAKSLLDKPYGEQIDSNDIVIRFNDYYGAAFKYGGISSKKYIEGPLLNNNLGSKINFNAVSGGCKSIDYLSRRGSNLDSYLIERFNSKDVDLISCNQSSDNKLSRHLNNKKVHSISAIKAKCSKILGAKPSVGFLILRYAYENLESSKISIFGFDWKKTPSSHSKNLAKGGHLWDEEKYFCSKMTTEKSWNLVL